MPMLVVVGATWCGYCEELEKRFQSDSSLRPLLAQFVCVGIDIDEDENQYRVWNNQYPSPDTGVPKIYVVTAQGEVLYNGIGAPQGEDLNNLLTAMVERSGGPRDVEAIARSLSGQPAEEGPGTEAAPAGEESGEVASASDSDTDSTAPPTARRRPQVHDPSEDTPAQRERRLESYLRMAEMYAETDSEKAQEYAQRILDLSPESDQAQAAKSLLQSLQAG